MKKVKVSEKLSWDRFGCSPIYFDRVIREKFHLVQEETESFLHFSTEPDEELSGWSVAKEFAKTMVCLVGLTESSFEDFHTMKMFGELNKELGKPNIVLFPAKGHVIIPMKAGIEDYIIPSFVEEESRELIDFLVSMEIACAETKQIAVVYFIDFQTQETDPRKKANLLSALSEKEPSRMEDIERVFKNVFIKFSFKKPY